MPGEPAQPIFHLFALGVCVGVNAHFSIHVGVTQILAFIYTNMLVSPTQNSQIGGIAQRPYTSVFASQWNIGLSSLEGNNDVMAKSPPNIML